MVFGRSVWIPGGRHLEMGKSNYGEVGVALWVPGHVLPEAGVLEVPAEVRQLWDGQMTLNRHTDIFKIEAVGPPSDSGNLSSIT